MAPAVQLCTFIAGSGVQVASRGAAARETRAARRHGHFAPKFAPDRRNFGAGKVELS